MAKELGKNFEPQQAEEKIYSNWLDKGYFKAEIDKSKKPFSIIMPPPNVTGQLHIGHALDFTTQDILIRTKRMQGYNTLWLPGTDHASISTELKVVERMREQEGLTKDDITREQFLERAWAWTDEFGGKIISQAKKLGSSCDFSRQRFTLDEGCSDAVLEVFMRLYEKGYIYRGEKLINWCPQCNTSISDAEVDHEDVNGAYYHFFYTVKETGEQLKFLTSRPETILGDTAIAVNPNDERYSHLVGKTVVVPIVNREIPIIADEYVDVEFGTGVVKITPAHDPNDFEVGQRHNLPIINVLNDDATMNANAGPEFEGLDRYDARKKVVEVFTKLGQFIKKEDVTHAVGKHERCGIIVEPMIKLQWFVKMEEMAKPALEALKTGDLNFVPERFGKTYSGWLENIHDWCISRQLWWGHRIPVYYCADCGHYEVAKAQPEKCSKCGCTTLNQDEDSLDTWFSSALWPFSTMGWPEKTEDLEHFYPTSVLVTAYDIIFFWVVRMVFSGIEQTGEVPFKDVLIHGLVRDEQGRKMSKSLGNGVDPIEIIDQYGTDVLRMSLIMGTSPGNDIRFSMSKLEPNRNFLNKVWNASKFVLMNIEGADIDSVKLEDLTPADKWILSKCNTVVKEVTASIEKYELGMACQKVYDFIWDEYCDWYIEMVKPRLYNEADPTRLAALHVLNKVLVDSLKLLHPFAPFITEELFGAVCEKEESIMISTFPVFEERFSFSQDETEIELMKETVRRIRNTRAEMNVPPSKKSTVFVVSENANTREIFERGAVFFKTLGYAETLVVQGDKVGIADDAVSVVGEGLVVYIPFAELVDIEKEIERLNQEKAKLQKEVERVVNKLGNESFVSKAPEKIILEERAKQEKYENMLKEVDAQIQKLSK